MFLAKVKDGSKEPYFGFAAAVTLHLAFKVTCMPALAIVTHCCSIASWIATRSLYAILSNSSMQMTPRSARTMAPASRVNSRVVESRTMAAVRPTPLEPRPVVLIAKGEVFMTNRSICDLPQDGSPTIKMLMSPRRWVPFSRFFSVPPIICSRSPALTFSCPQMEGAQERAKSLKASSRAAMFLMFFTSSATKGASVSSLSKVTFVAINLAGQIPLVKSPLITGKDLYTPVTCTRSPGLAFSQSSPSQITSMLRGICPGGALSGAS
mmetsp:Transcript_17799/g.38121  ORF Transcript_17799/g.38121 Transcript_17799/m.38121 type:complete len:266 (-) Transcript_17799:777-1574(-)